MRPPPAETRILDGRERRREGAGRRRGYLHHHIERRRGGTRATGICIRRREYVRAIGRVVLSERPVTARVDRRAAEIG